jgi:hypothetical protein
MIRARKVGNWITLKAGNGIENENGNEIQNEKRKQKRVVKYVDPLAC